MCKGANTFGRKCTSFLRTVTKIFRQNWSLHVAFPQNRESISLDYTVGSVNGWFRVAQLGMKLLYSSIWFCCFTADVRHQLFLLNSDLNSNLWTLWLFQCPRGLLQRRSLQRGVVVGRYTLQMPSVSAPDPATPPRAPPREVSPRRPKYWTPTCPVWRGDGWVSIYTAHAVAPSMVWVNVLVA